MPATLVAMGQWMEEGDREQVRVQEDSSSWPFLAQRGRCRRCTNIRVCTGITKSEPERQGVAKKRAGCDSRPGP
jgi:hypothetical protein